MRFFPALVALVAFGTYATAAEIKADLPKLNSLPILSVATSEEMLHLVVSSDLAADDRMIAAALLAVPAPDRAWMPVPAVFEIAGAGLGLLCICGWHRRAMRRIHRPGYVRKRRYEHPMASI